MRSINFDPDAWADFEYWLATDRKMARRITRLIAEIQRDPFTGIGKPEPLKGELPGYGSRRIDDEHRLVYRADNDEVKIIKAQPEEPTLRVYQSDEAVKHARPLPPRDRLVIEDVPDEEWATRGA